MGSNGVFIVWACECVAFLRFYYWQVIQKGVSLSRSPDNYLPCRSIKRHRVALQEQRIPQVRRWVTDDDDYPFRGYRQPFTAYMALLGCLFLLFVCNSAFLWKEIHPEPFLSSYLIVSFSQYACTQQIYFTVTISLTIDRSLYSSCSGSS